MNKLIELVNELQSVFATVGLERLNLPQIVVLGSQSSGKSSVLEGIVGRHFLPRGTGMVTRRPLLLQLESTLKKSVSKDFIRFFERAKNKPFDPESDRDVEFCVFSHTPDTIYEDYKEVEREISRETNRIAGSGKLISSEPIILKIFSPHVTDLTLVDLPGLTKIPIKDQPEDIESQIAEIVLTHVQNPNSVILVITPANVDIATSEAIKLAKSVDPNGDRTITVITKLDIMDKGTNAADVLSGDVINANLGIIGVVNRSQLDVDLEKSVNDALEAERKFFQENYPLIALSNGIGILTKTLNKILLNHIKKCFPDLKTRISTLKRKYQSIVETCGIETKDKNIHILHLITRFANNYREIVKGTTKNIATDELCGGARIYYIFYEVFGKNILHMDPLEGLNKQDILTSIRNAMGSKPALFVPELSFEILIQKQIARMEEPSINCVNLVHEEMQRAIKTTLSLCREITSFPNLHSKLIEVTTSILNTELIPTSEMVKNLLKMELSYINTNHPNFVNVAQITCKMLRDSGLSILKGTEMIDDAKPTSSQNNESLEKQVNNLQIDTPKELTNENSKRSRSSKKGNIEFTAENRDEANAQLIEILIKSYMNLMKVKFQDSVPKAISCFLINKVLDEIPSELIRQLYKENLVDFLLQESETVTETRENASKMMEALTQASKVIAELKEP